MRTGSRRFSPGFDGVHRGCASQSEKQRRGAKFCELAEGMGFEPTIGL